MAFLDARALVELFAWMERTHPVNDARVGDVHLWPFLRISLAYQLLDCDAGLSAGDDQDGLERMHRRIASGYAASAADALAGADPQPQPQPLKAASGSGPSGQGKGPVVIFTRAEEHYQETGGVWTAPILDPWVQTIACHHPVLKLEMASPLSQRRLPRHHPTMLLDIHPVPAPAAEEWAWGGEVRATVIRLWEGLAGWAADRNLALPGRLPEVLDHLGRVLRSRRLFGRLFAGLQPRAVFMNCYYHPEGLGMIWAAHDAGAPVIEVQHGNNGDYHYAYTHWLTVPAAGYRLLPDVFATWGRGSAWNIERWLPAGAAVPRVRVTGRLGSVLPLTADREGVEALDRMRKDFTRTILLSLQGTEWTGLTPALEEAIRTAPPDWLWLVRGHPIARSWNSGLADPVRLADRLDALGASPRSECRLASDLPLPALLARADHHVTHFSTSALEALAAGVPTTLVHPKAPTYFGRLIDRGCFYHALSGQSILASIHQGAAGLSLSGAEPEIAGDPALPDRFLRELLAPVHGPAEVPG